MNELPDSSGTQQTGLLRTYNSQRVETSDIPVVDDSLQFALSQGSFVMAYDTCNRALVGLAQDVLDGRRLLVRQQRQ